VLALTDDAFHAVSQIVSTEEASGSGPPAVAGLKLGLRLVAAESEGETTVEVAGVALWPEEDEVIEEQGVRLLLDPETASLLDGKTVDATVAAANEVEFTIVEDD
jgi:Fe-S cluster assembly iron-binding protein IscA